jgi:hypothetical protein
MTIVAQEIRAGLDIWGGIKLKILCTSSGNNFRLKKAAYRMGGNLCQLYI